MGQIKMKQAFLLFLASLVTCATFDRLWYLQTYEDEAADEFLETLKPNRDGTTFLDDSYFLWMSIRYEWRKGAENYDPALHEPKLTDEQREKLLASLQENLTLSTPLPLADVIDDEWRLWETEPDFPKAEQIQEMGIDDLIANGYKWVDGSPLNQSEPSNGSSVEGSSSNGEDQGPNPVILQDASKFGDVQ